MRAKPTAFIGPRRQSQISVPLLGVAGKATCPGRRERPVSALTLRLQTRAKVGWRQCAVPFL